MTLDSPAVRWTTLVVVNTPFYLALGWLIFRDWDGFWECIRFWLTPDWISLLRGEWWEDHWAELKLFLFVAICTGTVCSEYRFFFHG